MPALMDRQKLHIEQYPALFKDLLTSVLNIFLGEQLRVQDSGSEVIPQLIQEFTSYVYIKEPFQSHRWTHEVKPLKLLRLQTIKAIVNSRRFKHSSSDEPRRVQVLDLYCLTRFESEGSGREDVC